MTQEQNGMFGAAGTGDTSGYADLFAPRPQLVQPSAHTADILTMSPMI